MNASVAAELDEALRETLRLSVQQRRQIVQKLQAWVRARSIVPDTDERLWALLRVLPVLAGKLELSWKQGNLTVELVAGEELRPVFLLMSRGASWFQGGEWEQVVLTCVSRES